MRPIAARPRFVVRGGAVAILAVLLLVGCGSPQGSSSKPGIRWYAAREPNLCPLSLAVEPVVGNFDGSPTADGDQSWLVAPNGKRLYVMWPTGFSLLFQPGPTLRDARGKIVAERGTEVTLGQVNLFDHTGTMDDPYLAIGSVFDRCYAKAG